MNTFPTPFNDYVTVYRGGVTTTKGDRLTLIEALQLSKDPKVLRTVQRMRATADDKAYSKLKKSLPQLIPGGLFKNDHVYEPDLECKTDFFIIDIDHLDTQQEIDRVLKILQSLPYVLVTQISVSGKGVWGLIWYESANWDKPQIFKYFQQFFSNLCITIDDKCNDVYTRRRFLCPEEIWINQKPAMFMDPVPEHLKKLSQNITQKSSTVNSSKISVSVSKTPRKPYRFGDKTIYNGAPLKDELAVYLWELLGEDAYYEAIKDLDIDYQQYLPKRLERWGNQIKRKGYWRNLKPSTRKWLDEHIKPLITITDKNSNGYLLDTKYLNESDGFKKLFEKYVNDNDIFTLVAPTGTGKTVFIGNWAKKNDAVVLTHTINLRSNYTPGLRLVTEKNETDLKGTVMTYDRFVANYSNIRGYTIIVDEVHETFGSGDFRPSCYRLLTMLNELSKRNRVICVSATPGYLKGTYKELQVSTKIDRLINVNVLEFSGDTIEGFLKYKARDLKMTWAGDEEDTPRTVIFSDQHARKIFDELSLVEKDRVEIHHSKINKEINRQYSSNNLIEKDIALCTSVVYNGTNFNNKGHIEVFIPAYKNTTASTVIQAVGRFRNAKSITLNILYYDGNYNYKDAEILEAMEFCEDLDSSSNKKKEWETEYRRLYEEYTNKHGGLEKILEDLPAYFKKPIITQLPSKGPRRERNKVRIEIFKELLNGTLTPADTADRAIREKEVIKAWTVIQKMLSEQEVTIDLLDEAFWDPKNQNFKNKTIEKIINYCLNNEVDPKILRGEIATVKHYSSISRTTFDNDISALQAKVDTKGLRNDVHEIYQKKLDKTIEARDQYCEKTIEEAVDNLLEKLSETSQKRSKAGRKGGSKRGKNVRSVEIDGETYNSIDEAVEKRNETREQIRYKIRKKEAKYVE